DRFRPPAGIPGVPPQGGGAVEGGPVRRDGRGCGGERLGGADENGRRGRKARGPAMILVIDNYDSFTYNLVQYLGELGEEMVVRRNDEIGLDEIAAMRPDHIVLSPGPCTPNEAGICLALIERFKGEIPILGVCLGHQAIGQAFGGEVVRADNLMHGKTSEIYHDGRTLFRGLPSPFTATRYHSLIVRRETLPDCLE